MNILSWIILGFVVICFFNAVRFLWKHKNNCNCGSCASCNYSCGKRNMK